MLLLICFYFNVYHKCITSSSLKNFWHSSKRPVFDCTHCTNTEQHCICTVQKQKNTTDMNCTPLNITVHTHWLALYRTERHYTGILKYTVQKWPLYWGTDLQCKKLNNTVRGVLKFTVKSWTTLMYNLQNWTTLHGSIDLHITEANNTFWGTDLYCTWWYFSQLLLYVSYADDFLINR